MASLKERFAQKKLDKQLKQASPKEFFNLGLEYMEQLEFDKAINYFTKVISSKNVDNKNLFKAYNNRGLCYKNLKNYNFALEDYHKAIALNPNFSGAYANRGVCYVELKKYELALADFDKAISLNPNDAKAYHNRGNCYSDLKNYERALEDCHKAIALNINDAVAYYNRGNCYSDLKNHERALEDFNKAISLNPNYTKAYNNRGTCYAELKDYKLALEDYNKVIALNPNNANAETYNNRALCYFEQKKYNFALADFEKAIEYSDSLESQKQICFNANEGAIVAKQYDKARDYINKAFGNTDSKELQHKDIYLQNIENAQALDIKNQELEEKNKCLEETQHRMEKLVEQFTHSLGNVIFPDTIYQVAERIKNLPECRRDTLLLHEAYHAEIIIKLQAELLRQRYSNTNPEKFRLMIRNCRRNANAGDKTKTIEAILNYAVSRVTARFLNQHYAGLETIRNKILTQTHTDLNQLKQKFEDEILLQNYLSPLEWVSQNLRPIQITQISPLWKKVFILSDSYAEALLFGYFSEILFNAFKYADHENQEFLTLSFAEQTINEDIYLSCNWSNPTTNQKLSGLGTNQGLEAIAEDLKQLNSTEKPEQSLLICQQDNQFQVTLFFKKDLLIDDSNQLKIKRPVNLMEQA
jgi:tetratricopeptide (TPR) repeat protein